MAPKKSLQLKQEEFDEAVRTNIEDFGMEAEEAVTSAIEEFELQGYNLDGIIKTSDGSNTESHPVAVATRALADVVNNAASGEQDPQTMQQRVTALHHLFKTSKGDDLQQAVAVAAKENTVAVLLAAAKTVALNSSDRQAALISCLRTLRMIMQSPTCRSSLLSEGGAELIQQVLQDVSKNLENTQAGGADQATERQAQQQLAAAAASLTEAASWQDEEAKCRFMDMGVAADLLKLLQLLTSSISVSCSSYTAASAAGAAAGALRAFATADDDRPPASKAFMHARLLAGQPHNALQVLLPVLQQLQQGPDRKVGIIVAVVAAIRQIAANDEICKSFAESGGVASLQQLLISATEEGPPELVRSAAAALRQLANSDGIKQQLAEAGVLGTITRGVRVYSSSLEVQEQLLGLLVALVLRMPAIAAVAAEAGAVDVLTEVLAAAPAMATEMKAAKGNSSAKTAGEFDVTGTGADDGEELEEASKVFGVGVSGVAKRSDLAAAVQRQACMAIRNMVVRNVDLRPNFLSVGAEQLLRSVKVLFPSSCKDVASAALRDLGLDNYN